MLLISNSYFTDLVTIINAIITWYRQISKKKNMDPTFVQT